MFERLRGALKRLIPAEPGNTQFTVRTSLDSGGENPELINAMRQNSAVEACIDLIIRAVLDARLTVYAGEREVGDHESLSFLTRSLLSFALRTAYHRGHGILAFDVNEREELMRLIPIAYTQISDIQIARNQETGEIQRRYEIEDVAGGFGGRIALGPSSVIDIILQPKLDNPWLGESPFASAQSDIQLDTSLRTYGAQMMESLAQPTFAMSPDGPVGGASSWGAGEENAANTMLTSFKTKPGQGTAIGRPVKLHVFPSADSRLKVLDMNAVPESRIAAVAGTPPGLAGLLTGLMNTQAYAAVRAVMEHFGLTTIDPLLKLVAEQLTDQFLVRWWGEGLRFEFDTSESIYFAPAETAPVAAEEPDEDADEEPGDNETAPEVPTDEVE